MRIILSRMIHSYMLIFQILFYFVLFFVFHFHAGPVEVVDDVTGGLKLL